MVGLLWQDNPHIHTTNRRMADRVKKRARRNEIRACDPEALRRAVDRRKVDSRAGAPAFVGPGGEWKNRCRMPWRQLWRTQTMLGNLASHVVPVLHKGKLEPRHSGSIYADMGVAPRSELTTLAHVFVPHIQTAQKNHPGINDDQLAMISKIDLEAASKLPVGDKSLYSDAGFS